MGGLDFLQISQHSIQIYKSRNSMGGLDKLTEHEAPPDLQK